MSLSEVNQLGTPEDIERRAQLARVDDDAYRRTIKDARNLIFNHRHAVDSREVEDLLKAQSWTPTAALLADFMHEVELGVWKGLFIHLIRILEAHDKKTKTTIKEFNKRFRMVPSFGRDTIRRFVNDVSDLKQLAARDYEDLLQCCIPVFDGLLPEPYDSAIMSLLFTCAHWHGLAKLRMHTDPSITLLEQETERLYAQLRNFTDHVCTSFETYELKREIDARQRAKQRRDAKAATAVARKGKEMKVPSADASDPPRGPQRKQYHMQTVKHHFLADYPNTIREFGTMDSYSTEAPELEHKRPISRYGRTSRKYVMKQLAGLERRDYRIRRIRQRLGGKKKQQDDERVAMDPKSHHHIGKTENDFIDVGQFTARHKGDPAVKPNVIFQDFHIKLRKHLLPRILSELRSEEGADLHKLPDPHNYDARIKAVALLKHNRLYEHRTIRVNYTTYDVRRDQDYINGYSSHCNIIVLCPPADPSIPDAPPTYRYGRVIGTFHANVTYNGPGRPYYHDPHRMEVLWVRWYDEVGQSGTGWAHQRLDRLRFAPIDDDDAFGFLDPADVLRACHIIPRFHLQKVHSSGVGHSPLARDSSDWKEYYVNRSVVLYTQLLNYLLMITQLSSFVDRDMLMRYHLGLGIGHVYGHYCHSAYVASLSSNTPPAVERGTFSPSGVSEIDSSPDLDDEGSLFFSDNSDDDELRDTNLSDIDEGELHALDMYS
ncbi:hypothetical protein HWV62_28417 [Athelia sp. TMB]|nr:hypothetical protein HWV62_28417 [Athelia sp. TMB]